MIIYPYYLEESEYKYWKPYTEIYFDYFFKRHQNEKEIIFFHPDEYGSIIEDKNFFDKILNFTKLNNIKFQLWVGHHTDYTHENVINWKWWMAHFSNHCCKNGLHKTPQIKKLFTMYNRRARIHRCKFIDQIWKHNLQNIGYVSWHCLFKDSKTSFEYDFEYFDNKPIVFDDISKGTLENKMGYYINHSSFFDSVFHVVSESDFVNLELSEKTYKAVWMKRPFIVLGAKNIHAYLDSLGIKKFPIFDYDFDHKDNIDDRINGIIENIKNLSIKDYQDLSNKCIEVCETNYNALLQICKNDPIKQKFLELNDDSIYYQKYKDLLI